MKYLIRKADIEDTESITGLSNQLGYQSEISDVHTRLAGILKSNDHCVFVALAGEKLVAWVHGFYALRVESHPFVEIGGLVVDIEYRMKGVGKLLVDEITEWSSKMGCKKVRVRCNTIRKETHIFYQKLGFEINKEQKIFDKILK